MNGYVSALESTQWCVLFSRVPPASACHWGGGKDGMGAVGHPFGPMAYGKGRGQLIGARPSHAVSQSCLPLRVLLQLCVQ